MFPKLGMLYVAYYKVPPSLLCLPFSFESFLSPAITFVCYGRLLPRCISMNIHGYWGRIHIHIHEISRARLYSWILSMKKILYSYP